MRYDSFWTRRYLAYLYLHRRLRRQDFIEFFLVLIAIGISAQGKNFLIVGPLLTVYCGLALLRAWLAIRNRETNNAIQAGVFAGLCDLINKDLFGASNRTRFTLFELAPRRTTHIIPRYRFNRGGIGPVKEALLSRARYRRGEGATGRAWAKPATSLAIQWIPPLSSKEVMKAYYVDYLRVSPDTAAAISDHMVNVRCIISYTFLDSNDQFLGLLSLDVSDMDVSVEDVSLVPMTPEGGTSPESPLSLQRTFLSLKSGDDTINVESESLLRLVRAIGTVLQSFRANNN
jgi:hypothetical protein